ncbi:MAG: DUF4142 domain-containing protein [Nonomuraea sp.]|nr:DUF4142 domain-containing protein [Nonomuraea sp.]
MRSHLRGELAILGGFLAAAMVTIVLVLPPADPLDARPTTTAWGPVTPADRDLLIKVRQAGLWEMPAGDYAQTRAASPRVKQVGKMIMMEHSRLDAMTRQVAGRLGVELPSTPNADQQRWLTQLVVESGPVFDRDYVNLLRNAHGKVFSLLAAVRAGTRNSQVRAFAQEGMAFVQRHMSYLESTGLFEQDLSPR